MVFVSDDEIHVVTDSTVYSVKQARWSVNDNEIRETYMNKRLLFYLFVLHIFL